MKSFLWHDLTLLPQRAVWREPSRTLFVADVHIGKAATFRAAGLPAPAGTTRENLARLDVLIDALEPRTLVVLGDLFHARAAFREASLREFATWRARRSALAIRLVNGNHDARAGAPPERLGLEIVEEPHAFDGLECRHHPRDEDAGPGRLAIAGHLHPTARLHGPGHDSLRLPCFVIRPRQLILPAFGEFTGGAAAQADAETALCVVAGDRLVHAPASGRARDPLRGTAESGPGLAASPTGRLGRRGAMIGASRLKPRGFDLGEHEWMTWTLGHRSATLCERIFVMLRNNRAIRLIIKLSDELGAKSAFLRNCRCGADMLAAPGNVIFATEKRCVIS